MVFCSNLSSHDEPKTLLIAFNVMLLTNKIWVRDPKLFKILIFILNIFLYIFMTNIMWEPLHFYVYLSLYLSYYFIITLFFFLRNVQKRRSWNYYLWEVYYTWRWDYFIRCTFDFHFSLIFSKWALLMFHWLSRFMDFYMWREEWIGWDWLLLWISNGKF